VTLFAQFIHDIFFFNFSLVLERLNTSGFLLENRMTDLAILQIFLMSAMGKSYVASLSPVQFDILGPFVLLGCAKRHCRNSNQ
jgi:hypothetical protein